jgi:hypothetical protein
MSEGFDPAVARLQENGQRRVIYNTRLILVRRLKGKSRR